MSLSGKTESTMVPPLPWTVMGTSHSTISTDLLPPLLLLCPPSLLPTILLAIMVSTLPAAKQRRPFSRSKSAQSSVTPSTQFEIQSRRVHMAKQRVLSFCRRAIPDCMSHWQPCLEATGQ